MHYVYRAIMMARHALYVLSNIYITNDLFTVKLRTVNEDTLTGQRQQGLEMQCVSSLGM